MGTGSLVAAGEVTTLINSYGTAVGMIISTLLVLAVLFIYKGGFHWIL